ncbi:M23 family metallopeptidase [Nocardioides panacis]|uniref:M23 family metallopeptidase n=1 Tax=Nocardioides panacis TaxID=2849501 RepID=A0A975Y125_9ACTN|nr:M23 family metallopeptidase [Nocardioides panacis]QWZ09083.1 M23 family metallopeptidase [Nocardioides panacis]
MRTAPCRPVLRPLLLTLLLATAVLLAAPGPARADPAPGVWPLEPRPEVVSGFDPPGTRWGSGHRGVDLAGRVGQPVRAALAGRVTFAGALAGRGVVVVDHGATRTTYEPVAASASVGDDVGAGTVLGRLELFGSHCFPRSCLHWGLIEGREHYLDPLTLVGAGPVRLLPLDAVLPAFAGPVARSFPVPGPAAVPGPRGAAPLVRGPRLL